MTADLLPEPGPTVGTGRSGGGTMANFKRKRPKNARAGCLLCSPHKMNGAPPAALYRTSELRRLGGRWSRIARHDVGWRLREEEIAVHSGFRMNQRGDSLT